MKLIYCEHCGDLFNLTHTMKYCSCKKVFGRYIDDRNAEVSEASISIGMGSGSFRNAIFRLRNGANFKHYNREQAKAFGAIEHFWVRGNTAPSNPHTTIIK